MNSVPPCYVLGLETQIGLALVRELGMDGIPVIGIAQEENAIGLSSKYLSAGVFIGNVRSESGVAAIKALGDLYGAGVMLAVSEINTAWLIQHRNEFGKIRPLVPDAEAFAKVIDKRLTLDLASKLGIQVPRSAQPKCWEDVEQLVREFPFPAVMKWSDPVAVMKRLSELGIALEKAEYVNTPAEFLAAATRYRPLGEWPLLQQYCPGVGLGQFFFIYRGKAIRRFQHVRVAEWPPEGGFSSVCDSVPLDQYVELQELSIKLLQEIGWEGVAMVEYRLDPATGQAVLMEINGRFWGSFPLAVASGAAFGLLAYHVLGLGQTWRPSKDPSGHKRCRMVATELKRLHRILLQPKRIRDKAFILRPWHELARFVSDYFRPHVSYYVWSWHDPKPFFVDVRNALMRRKSS